jgi:hypothetical protein
MLMCVAGVSLQNWTFFCFHRDVYIARVQKTLQIPTAAFGFQASHQDEG